MSDAQTIAKGELPLVTDELGWRILIALSCGFPVTKAFYYQFWAVFGQLVVDSTLNRLVGYGLVELVGDNYQLTAAGKTFMQQFDK